MPRIRQRLGSEWLSGGIKFKEGKGGRPRDPLPESNGRGSLNDEAAKLRGSKKATWRDRPSKKTRLVPRLRASSKSHRSFHGRDHADA